MTNSICYFFNKSNISSHWFLNNGIYTHFIHTFWMLILVLKCMFDVGVFSDLANLCLLVIYPVLIAMLIYCAGSKRHRRAICSCWATEYISSSSKLHICFIMQWLANNELLWTKSSCTVWCFISQFLKHLVISQQLYLQVYTLKIIIIHETCVHIASTHRMLFIAQLRNFILK